MPSWLLNFRVGKSQFGDRKILGQVCGRKIFIYYIDFLWWEIMMEEGKKAWDLVFWNARGVGVGREFALFLPPPFATSLHRQVQCKSWPAFPYAA